MCDISNWSKAWSLIDLKLLSPKARDKSLKERIFVQ